jgi:hypothetical protein
VNRGSGGSVQQVSTRDKDLSDRGKSLSARKGSQELGWGDQSLGFGTGIDRIQEVGTGEYGILPESLIYVTT